ncbi:MAG TPA: hypothetical protein PLA50_19595, partial [Bacteroidia bacterium]|nr:hypothetical protein [Bacteroidia bacterium]
MIEPDDFGEQRTANHMPTIALSIAAVLLLVVGGMSYRESVRSSLEKQYEEKEARLLQRHGIAVPAPADQAPAANANPTGQAAAQPLPAGTVLYDAQGNPVYVTGAAESTYAQNVGAQTEASLPAPLDPDVLRMQQSLEQ